MCWQFLSFSFQISELAKDERRETKVDKIYREAIKEFHVFVITAKASQVWCTRFLAVKWIMKWSQNQIIHQNNGKFIWSWHILYQNIEKMQVYLNLSLYKIYANLILTTSEWKECFGRELSERFIWLTLFNHLLNWLWMVQLKRKCWLTGA